MVGYAKPVSSAISEAVRPSIVFVSRWKSASNWATGGIFSGISLTVFFQVLVAVRDSVKIVPESAVLSIRSLGGSRWDEYRHVVIPATMPAVFTSLRIGVGTAIAVLFIAEAMAGSTGLGYFIMQSWSMVNYPRMFAGIIALALLGVVLYAIFDIIERRLTRWRS